MHILGLNSVKREVWTASIPTRSASRAAPGAMSTPTRSVHHDQYLVVQSVRCFSVTRLPLSKIDLSFSNIEYA